MVALDGDPSSASYEALPSGVVTFVYTDIEGSTRLLRRLGDEYTNVLYRHRQILAEVWERNGGHRVDMEGDATLAAFERPDAAVAACAEAQEALRLEPWPGDASLLVRMGIHVGLAYPRNGDYVALAVHQAARIGSASHGGQILVSEEAARRVADVDDLELVSLGRFRVRDFDDPQELREVRGRGLPELPPPRLPPADGTNIVEPPTSLFGREADLRKLDESVTTGTILTIVGPGGIGKTRLAVAHAVRAARRWPDGVWFVGLDSIARPELIPSAIAQAVGAPAEAGADAWSEVLDHLQKRSALLVLDNCEHLIEALRELVVELIAACPTSAVLATSREPLGLRQEVVQRLPPLSVSDSDLQQSSAVQLFLARAAIGPDQQAYATNAAAIAELCRRLDGLPLAIELAAARASVMSPTEILRVIDERRPLLRSEDPSLPVRHRTLNDLLAWSYELLEPQEQAVLRRLSVFAASFSLDDASYVCADDGLDAYDVPEFVWSLVTKSLVVTEPTEGTTRYRLLATVRDYARALVAVPEARAVANRLADRYLAWLGPGCDVKSRWVGDMDLELDNLRSIASPGSGIDNPLKQRLAWSIGRYHDVVGTYRSGVDEISRFVEELPYETRELVALLSELADLHLRVGDVEGAAIPLERASRIAEAVGRPSWDDVGVERTEGEIALRNRNVRRAEVIAEQALARQPSVQGQARMWNLLGLIHANGGDLATARSDFERELAAWQAAGVEPSAAIAHGNLAEALLQLGDYGEASRHQLASLEIAAALGQRAPVAFSLMVAARLAALDGRWDCTVEFQTAADSILRDVGYVLYDSDRAVRDELLQTARLHLDDTAYATATERGRAMDLGAAVTAASDVLGALTADGKEDA